MNPSQVTRQLDRYRSFASQFISNLSHTHLGSASAAAAAEVLASAIERCVVCSRLNEDAATPSNQVSKWRDSLVKRRQRISASTGGTVEHINFRVMHTFKPEMYENIVVSSSDLAHTNSVWQPDLLASTCLQTRGGRELKSYDDFTTAIRTMLF